MLYLKFTIRWLTAVALVASAWPAEKSVTDLEREVKTILSEPDDVVRRARIAPVFELAARYGEAGETNKALSYYTKALEHQAWNLEAQMAVAQLLGARGQTNEGREKAEMVWSRAETDGLLLRAATFLGKTFETRLPGREPWPERTNVLALVPVGEVDTWLMRHLREQLGKILEIPVIIQQLELQISKPGRDAVHLKADELRDRIARANKEPQFQALLRVLKISTNGLADDEKVFALTEAVLKTEKDKDQVRRFQEELAFLRRLGPQWDAKDIVTRMQKSYGAIPGADRGYLGVTTLDLYANESRFLFGLAGGNCGIFSYRRYTAALLGEPPNRARLGERAVKQALSSVGLLFGLPRCTDPTCARAYVNDLSEHDSKQVKLCSQCQKAFAKRFGR